MNGYHWVIQKPLITEKTMQMLHENNCVSFAVNRSANKFQIKTAVEKIFNVTVVKVNVANVIGKYRKFGKHVGRTQNWKKALVQLKEGDKIEIFEGV